MKKGGKTLKIIGINAMVFIVLAELIAVASYFFNHRAFFYTDKQGRKSREIIDTHSDAGPQTRQLTDKRFHPFFGYTYQTGLRNTNNYGFSCAYDYPLKKESEDWYIIGIFGGSVADDFYREGRERLTANLKRYPFFSGKEIIYLNYALGGYKQPQQVQILTYFLAIGQELDLVINIDGFNEMVFGFNNNRLNVDIAMPSGQHFLPLRDIMAGQTLTYERLESTWKIQRFKRKLKEIQKNLEHTPLASIYLVLSAYHQYLYKKYRREIVRFDGLIKPAGAGDSLVNVKYTPADRDEQLLVSRITSLWSQCSLLMGRSLAAPGGKNRYFHFLQPNQYYARKIFTPGEQRNALDPNLAYSILVKKGYPALQQETAVLRKKGVNAFSAVEIFDKMKDTVYIDNCCHFNRLGHERFADFIAQCIVKSLGPGV